MYRNIFKINTIIQPKFILIRIGAKRREFYLQTCYNPWLANRPGLARPDRNAFQTLISQKQQELAAQNLITYSLNPKLRLIKAPKHLAGAFGQYVRFSKVY